ncbi:hypothetical protein ADIS_2351 [Lunatimonas lonarensis]|uniref:Uncharacterized protein n=1 Tax=Lunatimonas lonarensis TaxID=1232681 RepID=R7ZSM8_9BACT|nr:hypothetical protein ADIS_2351 [Lunatimonas lonarensis]
MAKTQGIYRDINSLETHWYTQPTNDTKLTASALANAAKTSNSQTIVQIYMQHYCIKNKE